jgi:hypothetical protein
MDLAKAELSNQPKILTSSSPAEQIRPQKGQQLCQEAGQAEEGSHVWHIVRLQAR